MKTSRTRLVILLTILFFTLCLFTYVHWGSSDPPTLEQLRARYQTIFTSVRTLHAFIEHHDWSGYSINEYPVDPLWLTSWHVKLMMTEARLLHLLFVLNEVMEGTMTEAQYDPIVLSALTYLLPHLHGPCYVLADLNSVGIDTTKILGGYKPLC